MTEATSQKPVIYIFHGDDTHSIRRHVDALTVQMGDPALADLNTTRLDGRQAVDDELFSAANSMPFMVERRLIILTNPFVRIQTDASRKRFLSLLNGLPDSTALVLIVEDVYERKSGGGHDWKSLPDKSTFWMRRWISEAGKRAFYQPCKLPAVKEMPNWVIKETQRQGGKINIDAASALVSHVGNDTHMASQDINKLLQYVDFKRAIELDDVEELTAQSGQADVFEMVDSLSAGNTRLALTQMHKLLETQDPLQLFAMVVRQFRLLIQARELLDEGQPGLIHAELHIPGFVADKLASQARRFPMTRLEDLYHRLLIMDEDLKTGQMPLELGLDTFVAGLAV